MSSFLLKIAVALRFKSDGLWITAIETSQDDSISYYRKNFT